MCLETPGACITNAECVGSGRRIRVESLEIVDPESMQPVERIDGPVRVSAAIWLGATRLIDNLLSAPPAW